MSLRPRCCAVGDLQREIMRCRRRQERASVLVAWLSADRRLAPRELVGGFRVTDSVTAARFGDGIELIGVFEEHHFEREGLERRLLTAARGAHVEIEWLRFPDDGVTLEALVRRGRAALHAPNGRVPAPRLGAAPLTPAGDGR